MSSEIRRTYGIVLEARQSSLETHSKLLPYAVDRGISSYENELPKWNNMSFMEIVEDKIASKPDGGPIKIVDIGCGNGSFLVSCALRWPGKVKCLGITLQEYSNDFLDKQKSAVLNDAGSGERLGAVEIHKADAMDIQSLVGQSSVDIAVALQSFRYFADPWMVLKRVYSALKEDGICLIDSINFNLKHVKDSENMDRIISEVIMAAYLRNAYGMDFFANGELHPLSFQKTLPRLTLPLRYAGKIETDELQHAIQSEETCQVVQYELDRSKSSKYVPSANLLPKFSE